MSAVRYRFVIGTMLLGLPFWTAGANAGLNTPDEGERQAGLRPEMTDLFVSGSAGYHTYRIPALLTTEKGTLLAFCEGRQGGRGDSGNIDLLLKRSTDGGQTWSPPQIVWDDDANTCGNPCPVQDRQTGTIWLLLTWNDGRDTESAIKKNEGHNTRRVFVSHSSDEGQTWSPPRDITASTKRPTWRWYATGPGVGIQLEQGPRKGRLLIPCDHSLVSPDDPTGYNSHVIYSDDHGRSWQMGGTISPAVNECQVVELTDGTLMMNMRNYDRTQTSRAIATSSDSGATWSAVRHDPVLVEPICQASFLRYTRRPDDDRNCLLFANPGHGERGQRRDLTVRASYDEGQTWPAQRLLWPGPAAYCCLSVLPDKSIACLLEGGTENPYERIVFARFTRQWLTNATTK